MAPATFTLRATYNKPNGEPQIQTRPVHIHVTGTKQVKDTAGNVIISGRVEADVVDGVLTVPGLPDPRDPGYNPDNFGLTVSAVFRDNHPPAVSFGAEALDAHLSNGVLELEDVTPVDPSTFAPTTTYAETSTVDALDSRVTTVETDKANSADLATVATTGNYTDLNGQPTIPATPADLGAEPAGLAQTTNDALTATFAPIEAQRRSFEAGKQIDATDSNAAWTKFVLNGATLTPGASPDPKVGTFLTFSAAGASGTLYRIMRDVNLDLSNSFLSFWLRTNDTNLSNFHVILGAENNSLSKSLDLFHTNASSTAWTPGIWHRVTVDLADAFRSGTTSNSDRDIRNFGIYTYGSGTATTVDIADIRVHAKGAGFEAGCIWQFDDASIETYTNAYPILASSGFVGSIPVEVDAVGTAGRMTVPQLQEVYDAGWELPGHHSQQIPAMTDAGAESAFRSMQNLNRVNGWDRGANYFVWPGGVWNATKEAIALRYFTHLRRISSPGNFAAPWVTERRIVPLAYITATSSVANVKALMDRAKASNGVVNLVFHKVVDSGATAENYNKADFQEVVSYAESIGLRSYTMTDLWGDGS